MNNISNIKNFDKMLQDLKKISIKYGMFFTHMEYRKIPFGKNVPNGFYQPLNHNLIVFRGKHGII